MIKENDDFQRPMLTVKQIVISEEIQSQLVSIITDYFDERPSLIDAFDYILNVVLRGEMESLDIYSDPCEREVEEDNDPIGAYICGECAAKLGAIYPEGRICACHRGVCDFCLKEGALYHTSDWDWPDARYLEIGREF